MNLTTKVYSAAVSAARQIELAQLSRKRPKAPQTLNERNLWRDFFCRRREWTSNLKQHVKTWRTEQLLNGLCGERSRVKNELQSEKQTCIYVLLAEKYTERITDIRPKFYQPKQKHEQSAKSTFHSKLKFKLYKTTLQQLAWNVLSPRDNEILRADAFVFFHFNFIRAHTHSHTHVHTLQMF